MELGSVPKRSPRFTFSAWIRITVGIQLLRQQDEKVREYYNNSRDMDFDASVFDSGMDNLGFFVHVHPDHSVGHLHIHCCLTNLVRHVCC